MDDGPVKKVEIDQLEVVSDRLRIQVAGELVAQLVRFPVEGNAHGDLRITAFTAGEQECTAEHEYGRERHRCDLCELSAQCFDHIAS